MIPRSQVLRYCKLIVPLSSKRSESLPKYRFFSHYYDDSRFTDRLAMLRRQQMNMQKTTMSEQLLGLRKEDNENGNYQNHSLQYTMKELRTAYFQAAKQCHPDSQSSYRQPTTATTTSTALVSSDATAEERFIMVTNAYEYLRQQLSAVATKENDDDSDDTLTDVEEEEQYRRACLEYLGQPAEIVEESKRCPIFRQWLFGRTDAAFYWQSFFMLHGGLAPQLRTVSTASQALLLSNAMRSSDDNGTTTTAATPATAQRRRRPQPR